MLLNMFSFIYLIVESEERKRTRAAMVGWKLF